MVRVDKTNMLHAKEPIPVVSYRQFPVLDHQKPIALIAGAICVVVAVVILVVFLHPGSTVGRESEEGYDSNKQQGLSDAEASGVAKVDYTQKIEEELQYPEMAAGCEISSLASVLHALGFDVADTDLADGYLYYDDVEGVGYFGSPYEYGAGFPPAIAATADAYLKQQESSFKAVDYTGHSFDELLSLVDRGYPVLVWTTMYFEEPLYTDSFVGGHEWYDNEHCVVLYGYSDQDVSVMDPLSGLIEVDIETFSYLYEQCGLASLVIM